MKLPHWIFTIFMVIVLLYVGKMFGSKLPAIPGISGS